MRYQQNEVKGQIWNSNLGGCAHLIDYQVASNRAAITPETEPWTPYSQADELSWREQSAVLDGGSTRGQPLDVRLFGAWSRICNDEIIMNPRGPLPSGQCTSSWYNKCVVRIDSSYRNESPPPQHIRAGSRVFR